jgi:hypothetical protein
LVKYGPIGPFTTLNLSELTYELPPPAVQVFLDGAALSVETETATALALGGDSVIGDELPLGHDINSDERWS